MDKNRRLQMTKALEGTVGTVDMIITTGAVSIKKGHSRRPQSGREDFLEDRNETGNADAFFCTKIPQS